MEGELAELGLREPGELGDGNVGSLVQLGVGWRGSLSFLSLPHPPVPPFASARIPVGWSGGTSAPRLTLGPQGLSHKRTPYNMGSLGLGLGGPVRLSRVELS